MIIQKNGKSDRDFDGIRWVISVRSKDAKRDNIRSINIDSGVMVGTDGHRLHLYTPERELKDGTYEVVTDTAKTIVLEPSDVMFPDYERVFPQDTHNGIKPINTPSDTQRRDNSVLNGVLKQSDLCYNTKYLSEACPCDETLHFLQSEHALIIRNSDYSKGAIVMELRIES